DAAGSFTFRRPLPDFPLPRHGAGCPLWPLYSALCRPLTPMRGTLELTGQQHGAVRAFAMAAPKEDGSGAEELPLIEAHMLLVGGDGGSAGRPKERARLVGVACRICSKDKCEGRREPSILREGV
ncbi:MAG: transcriptional regulator, partial [Rhodobacteraceae bacterium]|nr:transcriptional regulator [Paracoccaceae bacterium]